MQTTHPLGTFINQLAGVSREVVPPFAYLPVKESERRAKRITAVSVSSEVAETAPRQRLPVGPLRFGSDELN